VNCPKDDIRMVKRHRIDMSMKRIAFAFYRCHKCNREYDEQGNRIKIKGDKYEVIG
jgi:transposase-like protein